MINRDPVSQFDRALDAYADLKSHHQQRRRGGWFTTLVALLSFIAGLLCGL